MGCSHARRIIAVIIAARSLQQFLRGLRITLLQELVIHGHRFRVIHATVGRNLQWDEMKHRPHVAGLTAHQSRSLVSLKVHPVLPLRNLSNKKRLCGV